LRREISLGYGLQRCCLILRELSCLWILLWMALNPFAQVRAQHTIPYRIIHQDEAPHRRRQCAEGVRIQLR
jgi:hypothetical protein